MFICVCVFGSEAGRNASLNHKISGSGHWLTLWSADMLTRLRTHIFNKKSKVALIPNIQLSKEYSIPLFFFLLSLLVDELFFKKLFCTGNITVNKFEKTMWSKQYIRLSPGRRNGFNMKQTHAYNSRPWQYKALLFETIFPEESLFSCWMGLQSEGCGLSIARTRALV